MPYLRAKHLARCLLVVMATAAPDAAVSGGSEVDWCATRYERIDIGPLTAISAPALNDAGQVAVNGTATDGGGGGFLWQCDSGLKDVGVLPGFVESEVASINARGELTGRSIGPSGWQAFVFNPVSGIREVPRGPEIWFLIPVINDRGVLSDGVSLWSEDSGLQPVRDFIGVRPSDARVDNFGRISGVRTNARHEYLLYSWNARDGRRDVKPAGDIHYIETADMSLWRGDLLGNLAGPQTAFIMDSRGELELLPRGPGWYAVEGRGINDRRQVVGRILFSLGFGDYQPFLWDREHGYRNLDELAFGQAMPTARIFPLDINNWGWIAASVDNRAALLVPVPAQHPRFRNLNRLRGKPLCQTLRAAQLHAFACALLKK
jgi:hypothetical protein